MKKHRFRPAADRKANFQWWEKDKRGNPRHHGEEVSEVEYCHRATRERPGFHKGARLRAY